LHRVTKIVLWTLAGIGALAVIGVVVMPGCGRAREKAYRMAGSPASPRAPEVAYEAEYDKAGGEEAAEAPQLSRVLTSQAAAAVVVRQIIYNADLTMKTEDAEAARQKVVKLSEEAGGFLADSTTHVGEAGERYVDIKIRVPASRFSEVVAQIRQLGKVEHESITSQDVTEEFIDLQARLHTLNLAEERLLDMLKRRGKLSELLEIERELATRREQIEQTQGRLRYLKDRVSFSTIQVSLYEKGPAVVGPSGPYDILYHVRSAYRVLVGMLQGILTALIYIVVDGVVIWLPVLLLIWFIVRRRRRRQV